MKNLSFFSNDFFISHSQTLGVCSANDWIRYYSSLDDYRKFDLDCFFRYLSLCVAMDIGQPYKMKSNNQLARSIVVNTPNNAKLKVTIQEFPGFELFEQRLLFYKINVDVTELNKLATEIISKQSDPEQVTKTN